MLNEELQSHREDYQLIPLQLSLIRIQQSEATKRGVQVVCCCRLLCTAEAAMASPVQFIYSCYFLSKQTQACSYRKDKNELGNNRLHGGALH